MLSISSIFKSFRSKDVILTDEPKPLRQEKQSFKSLDAKTVKVAKVSIKGHYSEKFLNSISDFFQKQKMKNNRNIFIHYLNTDLKHLSVKKNDLKVAINYCIKRTEAGDVTETERHEMTAFFDKFSYLPKEIFDRKVHLGGKFALQRLLSPELDELLKKEEQNSLLKANTEHQLNIAMAKAALSVRLGHGVSMAGNGVNGAQIIRDLEGSPVGVFKPVPDVKWYQVSEQMKNYFGQARLLNQKDTLGQQFAEVAAHQFDETLGFKLAPAATMAKLKGKEGAFLAFLSGYEELKKCEDKLEARTSFEKEEKKKWQMMCIYNFLTGNMDPHNENIFVRMGKNNRLEEIRMIDHGNCFIEANPGEWGSKGNQGHWGNYKISKEAFEPETIDFIRNNLTEEKLDQFVSNIGKERENFWTINMDQRQRERLQLIRDGILQGKITTPQQLSKIHTSNDFQKHMDMGRSLAYQAEETDLGDFSILDIK